MFSVFCFFFDNKVFPFSTNVNNLNTQFRLSDLMLHSSEQLARRVIGLSLRTNELTNAMQLSKEHMDKIRSDNQKSIRLEKQMAHTRLKEQKNHYETIVTRHQEFIEQVGGSMNNRVKVVNSHKSGLLNFIFFFLSHLKVAQR